MKTSQASATRKTTRRASSASVQRFCTLTIAAASDTAAAAIRKAYAAEVASREIRVSNAGRLDQMLAGFTFVAIAPAGRKSAAYRRAAFDRGATRLVVLREGKYGTRGGRNTYAKSFVARDAFRMFDAAKYRAWQNAYADLVIVDEMIDGVMEVVIYAIAPDGVTDVAE